MGQMDKKDNNTTLIDGTKIKTKKLDNGNIARHCSSGPAIIYPNGDFEYWFNGIKLDENMSIITKSKTIIYFNENMNYHKIDGPAYIKNDEERWYINGVLHRENGPAIIHYNGENTDPMISWILDQKKYSFESWCNILNKTDEEQAILKIEWSNGKRNPYENVDIG